MAVFVYCRVQQAGPGMHELSGSSLQSHTASLMWVHGGNKVGPAHLCRGKALIGGHW